MLVPMLKAVITMLSGDLQKDWGTRIVCAKAILEELVKSLETTPKSSANAPLDEELDPEAAEAAAELRG